MPGVTRPVQGGAYSGPRSEPGGQNTPRAGRVVASQGTYTVVLGTFMQQIQYDDATLYDSVLDLDNPVSHWKLGDPNTAIDRKGMLNLPAVGGPIGTAAGLIINNASNQSNVFTGVTNVKFDAGTATNRGVPYEGAFTIEAWVKPTADADGMIVKRALATGLTLLNTGTGTQVQLKFDFENSANVSFSLVPSGAHWLTVNQTYHVVGTYDGTTAIYYIDGVEIARTTSVGVGGITSSPTSPPIIGTVVGGGSWPQAVVDEVAWYNGALSPARILEHYNAGSPGDAGSGTITVTGSGIESYSTIIIDSAMGIAIASGIGVESYSHDASATGIIMASGIGVEVYAYTDTGAGTITASGTGVESQGYIDSRTVTITVSGIGFETITPYDAVLDEDNPVSHWKLGDANTAIDRRGRLNLPAVSGPIGTAAGLVANNASDQSNVFTGVVNVSFDAGSAANRGAPYEGAYTIEAWVAPTADDDSVIVKRITGTGLLLANTGTGKASAEFDFSNSANVQFFLSAFANKLTLNQTYHLVGTYDGTIAILYINGAEVARTTSVGVGGIRSNSTVPPIIGGAVSGHWPRAVVDEVAWYNGALTPARILAHYQAGVATAYDAVIDADSPVSHWKMGLSTTRAVDRARRKLNLDAQNPPIAISDKGVVYQSDNDLANTFATGSSQVLSRSDSGFAGSDATLYNTSNLSVEAWIKPTVTSLVSNYGIVFRSINQVALGLSAGNPRFEFVDPAVVTKVVTGPTSLTASAVYHLVGTYDGANLILYVNGAEVARLASATGIRSDLTVFPRIGRGGANYWDGDIDEVAWYDTALSPARVRAHYLAGLAGYITPNGTNSETAVYTNSASGSIVASGSGVETADYIDNASGTITTSGSGVENYQPPVGIDYTDSASGTITVLGISSESIAVDDTSTGTIVASGTATEAFSVTDTSIGTLTASGTGTDNNTHSSSAIGVVTASGSSLDTAVHTGSGTGSIVTSGTGTDSYIYSDTGTGTIFVTGTATDFSVYTDVGTGSITASGTGVDAYIYSDVSTGTIAVTGTRIDFSVYSDTGTGNITASGTSSDIDVYTDISIGTIVSTGTGTDVFVHSGLSSGTATFAGTNLESATYVDGLTGTALVNGTSSETVVYTASAIGTVVASGIGLDSRVYDDAGSGTALLSGTGVDSWAILIGYIDARSGQINLSGTGVESQSHDSTAIASGLTSGTSVESQSHSSTAIGNLVADGTGVESQSHSSTAIGFGLVSGTASETYSSDIPYTDASTGTITSTGTGVDSVSYSSTLTGTVTFVSSGVDSYVGEDASIGTIVLTGTARESSGYAQAIQPGIFSTVVALDPIKVSVWAKTPIQSVVSHTAPLAVQIVVQHNVKADVVKRNELKVLMTTP